MKDESTITTTSLTSQGKAATFKMFTVGIPKGNSEAMALIEELQRVIQFKKHTEGQQQWVHWVAIIRAGAKELGYLDER